MPIEFKNINEFRSYPFQRYPLPDDDTLPLNFVNTIIVDAQFDVFCDGVRLPKDDTAPLVALKLFGFWPGTNNAYTLALTISVGFGLRSNSTDKPIRQVATSRKWFNVGEIKVIPPENSEDDADYIYLWISDSGSDFDAQIDPTGVDSFDGTDVYITGYIAINAEYLRNYTGSGLSIGFIDNGVDEFGNTTTTLGPATPILEEGTVTFTGAQLVRNIYIANKEPIRPPDSSGEVIGSRTINGVLADDDVPEVFQNDVKLEEGFNCRTAANRQTGVITITPVVGAGQGEPCTENDPDEEDGCSDYMYSINGVNSGTGNIEFQCVPPLQVSAGDPTLTSGKDYTRGTNFPDTGGHDDENFWEHALIFRIGSWGATDDVFCAAPECDE